MCLDVYMSVFLICGTFVSRRSGDKFKSNKVIQRKGRNADELSHILHKLSVRHLQTEPNSCLVEFFN